MNRAIRRIRTVDRLLFMLRRQKLVANLLGPVMRGNANRIEIDITYRCNLRCTNCNRSCTQAPSTDKMTAEQISRFIKESIEARRRWKTIRILGGEPTLHDGLAEITEMLCSYKTNHLPDALITLVSNGSGRFVKSVLNTVPALIHVENSRKDRSEYSELAYIAGRDGRMLDIVDFNDAPSDHRRNILTDYSNGCRTMAAVGMGLSPYGYYCCSVAAGIDRVFGFDIGRKMLPERDDLMIEQRRALCRLCGHFFSQPVKDGGPTVSPVWRMAYQRYSACKPTLSVY